MKKATRTSTARPVPTVRLPTGREALEFAALHMTCIHLEYLALKICANAPTDFAAVAAILSGAAVKLRDFPVKPELGCGPGFRCCNKECIPDSDPPCGSVSSEDCSGGSTPARRTRRSGR